jgi:predicted nucleic acid-binding Zn ribbon protein
MFTRNAKPRLVRCIICGADFKAIRRDAVTCGARCRKTAWLLKVSPKDQLKPPKRLVYQQTCEVCLKGFVSKRSDAQTCSDRCRKARSRSEIGHLDRLERLAGNYDEAEARKEAEARDRRYAERFEMAFGHRPELRKRKRPDSWTRKSRRMRAHNKHLGNIVKQLERISKR